MILSNIDEAGRYMGLSTELDMALRWLITYNPAHWEEGEIELGHGIIVKCEAPGLMPRERVRLESHRRYIDIHVPIKGNETIGWARTRDMRLIQQPYDHERDITFYGDMAQCLIHLTPGQMAVFFPEDAHAPNIGIGNHHKLCIKIPV